MIKYILKRLILLTITVIISTIVVFFLLELMKGYPEGIRKKIEAAKDQNEINKIILAYEEHGDVFTRFFNYVKGLFNGNFGIYYKNPNQKISEIFIEPLKWTMLITGPAFLIGTILGLICGFIAGYNRGKWPDIFVNFLSLLFVAIPSFVLATFMIMLADKTNFPFDLRQSIIDGETFKGMILPIFIISITSFSTLTYYIRNEVVEVLTSDYIQTARSKGVSEIGIFFKHIIRNVSIPIFAIIFYSFIGIVFGSLIIERFFGVPGSADVFVGAVQEKEKYVILFSVLFFSSFTSLIALIVDISYVFLDPRIKLTNKNGFQPFKYLQSMLSRQKSSKRGEKNG